MKLALLFNLFSDPEIIRIPFTRLQNPSLVYFHATNEDIQENYRQIGVALLGITEAQAQALQEKLGQMGQEVNLCGMRYWHPFTEAIASIKRDRIDHL